MVDTEVATQIREAMKRIASAMHSDSHIQLNKLTLATAIRKDYVWNGGHVPEDEECTTLVYGDEEGGVPETLKLKYPSTYAMIGTYYR